MHNQDQARKFSHLSNGSRMQGHHDKALKLETNELSWGLLRRVPSPHVRPPCPLNPTDFN